MDETTPLLQSVYRSKRKNWIRKLQCKCLHSVKYRLPTTTGTGTIVVTVWNMLMCIALCCNSYNFQLQSLWSNVIILTFPVAGYVADTWVGRFKVLQTSMVVSLAAAFFGTTLCTAQLWTTSRVVSVLMDINVGMSSLGIALYTSCFVPFTMDHLVGASAW